MTSPTDAFATLTDWMKKRSLLRFSLALRRRDKRVSSDKWPSVVVTEVSASPPSVFIDAAGLSLEFDLSGADFGLVEIEGLRSLRIVLPDGRELLLTEALRVM
jgi:hypothetical protein